MAENSLVLFFCDNGSKNASEVNGEGGLALHVIATDGGLVDKPRRTSHTPR